MHTRENGLALFFLRYFCVLRFEKGFGTDFGGNIYEQNRLTEI